MPTITFSERPLGTVNPTYTFSNNAVHTTGVIVTDGAQPASPVIAANSSYLGPVFIFFDHPVTNVSVNVGYFDNLASTRIEFRDAQGGVLQSVHNTIFGVQTFSFANSAGIGSIAAIDEKFDAAGFSLDTVVFGDPADTLDPPIVTAASNAFGAIDRNFGTVGSSSLVFSDAVGGADPFDLVALNATASGTATITSYLDDNPSKKFTFTINVQQGLNTFQIAPGEPYNALKPYRISINLNLTGNAKDQAVDEWIDDTLAKIMGTTLNFHEFGADLLRTIEQNVDNASDAVKFLSKLKKAYGFLGFGLDIADRIDSVAHAADFRKQLFIEAGDMFVGWAATGVVGVGVSLAATPIAGLVAGFVTGVVYTFGVSDNVRAGLGQIYNDHLSHAPPFAPDVITTAVNAVNLSAIAFDPNYYLSSNPDAQQAVLSGSVANAYLHYLYVGADLGYKPNAGASPIPPNEIVAHQVGGNAAQGYSNVVFSTVAGALVGDHLSTAEAALASYLNVQRTDGTEFGLDAALSTLANRVARDWAINNPTGPAHAFDPAALSQWASILSNGKSLAGSFAGLAGLPAGLNLSGLQLLASYTPETEAAQVFKSFMTDPLGASKLLGVDQHSIGIGEYGGVWVVLLNTTSATQTPVTDSSPVNVNLFGTGDRDILYAGGGVGRLSGSDGADDLAGGALADLLLGEVGDDRLEGRVGNDTLDGGPGIDSAIFSGARSAYTVIPLGVDGVRIVGPDGTDTVKNVEQLVFDNQTTHWPLPDLQPNDFNGEGHGDILWRHSGGALATWELNGTTFNPHGFIAETSWHVVGTGDFNGDFRSDVLWRHDGGTVATWEMNGGAFTPHGFTADTAWHVIDTGDFNGDGRSDILWRHNDGTVATWEMNGGSFSAHGFAVANAWHIAGTDDFNGDGRSDILWRHDNGTVATWEMNSGTLTPHGFTADIAWHIAGTGDFNGDGRADILWRHDNGTVATWEMNGSGFTPHGFVVSNAWHIADTGDFNGDGRSEILWRHDNGTVETWEMNGNGFTPHDFTVGTAWHISDTGDFNGDGRTDILWRHDSGTVATWEMNGATFTPHGFTAGTDWQIVGHHFDLI